MGSDEQRQIQIDKYKECLIHINYDLGILLQNAENLAYILGAISNEHFHYSSYDYYNQYDKKDIWTVRKNIISSLKFIKAQLNAIKEESGKEYIFPPSIDKIKYDIKTWKALIEKISPSDVQYYDAILEFLEKKKFIDVPGSKEIYNICYKQKLKKQSDVTPYMWMFISPPLLCILDKNCEENEVFEKPDITIDGVMKKNDQIDYSQKLYQDTKEINALLSNINNNSPESEYEKIIEKIKVFLSKYKISPPIDKGNESVYDKIIYKMMR